MPTTDNLGDYYPEHTYQEGFYEQRYPKGYIQPIKGPFDSPWSPIDPKLINTWAWLDQLKIDTERERGMQGKLSDAIRLAEKGVDVEFSQKSCSRILLLECVASKDDHSKKIRVTNKSTKEEIVISGDFLRDVTNLLGLPDPDGYIKI